MKMISRSSLIMFTAILAILSVGFGAELRILTSQNFEDLTQVSTGSTTGAWLVKFYAPWCGHCKTLAPVWDELVDKLADEAGQPIVNVAKVDVTQNRDLGTRFEIKGFPTIKLLKDGKQYTYKGRRNADDIAKFATDGYATDTPEIVRQPVGFFGEIKYAFADIYKQASADVKKGSYFTQHTIIIALPAVFLLMILVVIFLPDPAPERKPPTSSSPPAPSSSSTTTTTTTTTTTSTKVDSNSSTSEATAPITSASTAPAEKDTDTKKND